MNVRLENAKEKIVLILKHTKNKGFCLVYFDRAARRVCLCLTHKASLCARELRLPQKESYRIAEVGFNYVPRIELRAQSY